MNLDQQLQQAGVSIEHFFGGREYAKKTSIPAGVVLTQHKHRFDHLSILSSGQAKVTVDGISAEYGAGSCILIAAGSAHSVQALTDVVWFCIHGTDEQDLENIDQGLIA